MLGERPHDPKRRLAGVKTRRLSAFVLAVLASVSAAPSALAHAYLERSEPADGAVLVDPPSQVWLWFSEELASSFSTAELLGGDGRPIQGGFARPDPGRANVLILTLPDLRPNLYSVRWKVLSEEDGHFRQGFVVFRVGAGPSPVPPLAAGAQESAPSPFDVALRWLSFSFLAGLVGVLAVAQIGRAHV